MSKARGAHRQTTYDPMATKLSHPLKRELEVGGKPYVLTITNDGLMLVPKGRRKGRQLAWGDLVSGEAALATALNASLQEGRLRPVRRAR